MIGTAPSWRWARRWSGAAAILALLGGGLTACGGGATLAAAPVASTGTAVAGVPGQRVRVVAAEDTWGSVAAQVGGRRVEVTSIITSPTADPHLYESDAANAAAVARAQVVVYNGLGYDRFMTRLLAASGTHPVVVSAQAVLHAGPDANPHLWYDLAEVPAVARAIEEALARVDPAGRPSFRANLGRFDASLGPVLRTIHEIRAASAGAPVAYTERVAGYLVSEAGLRDETPPGFARAIENGNTPSPRAALAMDALLEGHRVRALLYNTQTVGPLTLHARSLARRAGIPVIAVSETMPLSDGTYQHWQLMQDRALLRALLAAPR